MLLKGVSEDLKTRTFRENCGGKRKVVSDKLPKETPFGLNYKNLSIFFKKSCPLLAGEKYICDWQSIHYEEIFTHRRPGGLTGQL